MTLYLRSVMNNKIRILCYDSYDRRDLMKTRKIKLSKIKVPKCFEVKPPKKEKMKDKLFTLWLDGFDSLPPIIIDKHYNLIDGYCTYLIACRSTQKKVECKVSNQLSKFVNIKRR